MPVVADGRSYAVPGQAATQIQRSFAHDLTAALGGATGLPLHTELGSFPQLRQAVEAGRGDVLGPMYPAPWLPKVLQATEPVGEGVLRAYTLPERVRRLDAPLQQGVRVAVVSGLFPENWLRINHPGLAQVTAPNFDEAIKLLVAGKADVYLGFEALARRDIHLLRLQEDLIEGAALARVPQAFLVHQRNPQLLAQMNEGIRSLRNTGQLDAIRKQWEPEPVMTVPEFRTRRLAQWSLALSVVVVAAALVALVWMWRRAVRLARERGQLLRDMQWAQALESQTFDASPTPMSISRASDQRLMRVNDAYVRAFGFSRDQLLAMRGPARPWANPGEREALIA